MHIFVMGVEKVDQMMNRSWAVMPTEPNIDNLDIFLTVYLRIFLMVYGRSRIDYLSRRLIFMRILAVRLLSFLGRVTKEAVQ